MSVDLEATASLVRAGEADSEAVSTDIAELGRNGQWDSVYLLSALAGREVSVLIDAEGGIHVDWGGPGQVPLRPPIGAKAPFRLWVHTHPFGGAYWSATDRRSLANGTLILDRAFVLGRDGLLSTTKQEESATVGRLDTSGPLSRWTEERVQAWETWAKVSAAKLRGAEA